MKDEQRFHYALLTIQSNTAISISDTNAQQQRGSLCLSFQFGLVRNNRDVLLQ